MQRRVAVVCGTVITLLAVGASAPAAEAAKAPAYKVRPDLARELISEAATTPAFLIYQAWCVVNVHASAASDPTSCLIVAKNGPNKPLFCGLIYTTDTDVASHTLLPDTDYSRGMPCAVARKYLHAQGPLAVRATKAQRFVSMAHSDALDDMNTMPLVEES